MPERDYGLADIVQRSGTARAGLLRDLGQAEAQNRLTLGAAQAQGYQDQGQRSALLAGSLAKIVGGAVEDYQTGQKIKIAQQAEVRKAQADAETAARDQQRTDIAAQDLALKQHAEALKAQDAALGVFANLGQHALDHPEAWPTVLSAVSALSPEIVKTYGLTPDFDPEKIKVAMQAGTDHKTQIEADKLALAQREQLDKETGPTAVADQLKNMIQFATVDKTPEGLAARAKVINSWVPVKGHEEAFNKAREMFNAAPQNPDALRALALTPEQNVQAEQNAATGARLEAASAETARHNQATEANAAKALSLRGGTASDPETVAAYVRMVKQNGTLVDVPATGGMRNAVVKALGESGVDIQKLTAQDLSRKNIAKTILPKFDQVAQMARDIDKLGLTGTLGGRWRKLISGETAASDLAGLTPEQKQLVGRFASEASGLLLSGIAMAHGGARGGGSPQLLEQVKQYLDPANKDLDVYLGNLAGAREFINGYATMGQAADQPSQPAFPPKGTPRVVDGVAYVSDGTKFVKK